MGAVVAGSAGAFDSLEPSEISTPDELECLRHVMISDNYQNISASFEAVSDHVVKATIQGNIEDDTGFSRYQDRAKLRSFLLKSDTGRTVRFTLEGDSVSIHRYGGTTKKSDIELPDYPMVYLVAQAILYAIYSVDQFIDRNGLRPVVEEVKERRWAILVTCSILAVYF